PSAVAFGRDHRLPQRDPALARAAAERGAAEQSQRSRALCARAPGRRAVYRAIRALMLLPRLRAGASVRRPAMKDSTVRASLPLLLIVSSLLLAGCQRDDAAAVQEAGAPTATPVPPNETAAGQRIEAETRELADDAMQGRETGTPGYD